MALVTSEKLLLDAQKGGYAVGAFNVENLEMVQAVIAAAAELSAPVILQTTPGTLRYAGPETFFGMAGFLAEKSPVPIALHLDHGDSFELAERAVQGGYTSVMIDGSRQSFEDNIALTCRVVAMARAAGVPVEAELGKVGGKEDDLSGEGGYTDPREAAEFASRTGVSSFAVAIGTAHGVYHGTPRLDIPRLKEIRRLVDIPLVLHGASGLSREDVRACIAQGICKVNFATELRMAYTAGVREFLARESEAFDPKKYGAEGRRRVTAAVREKICVCGCQDKAKMI